MIKISNAEMAIMAYLWKNGESQATTVAKEVAAAEGIDRNTAYTYIQRLVKKGHVTRRNPGFFCTPTVTKTEVCRRGFRLQINRLFEGSPAAFICALAECGELSEEEIDEIKAALEQKTR